MNKKIICNATPIISLLKVKQLDILHKLFGDIIIPKAVYYEITEYTDSKKDYINIEKVGWIKVKEVKDEEKVQYLLYELDKGEAEVIVLGKEIDADMLLIDEIIGRKIARMMKLKVKGIIGCLILAKEKELVNSIKEILYDMKNKGIWFDDKLITEILKQIKEI